MSNIVSHSLNQDEEFIFPEKIKTLSGAKFDPREMHWLFRDAATNCSMDFASITNLSPRLMTSFQLTLLYYLQNMSIGHSMNMFRRMWSFFKFIESHHHNRIYDEIHDIDLINYKSTLSRKTEWYLSGMAGFLKKWFDLGYPGVNSRTISFFNEIRLSGNIKGEAILTMDPIHGPFSELEFKALQERVDHAYKANEIDLESYLLVCLFMMLGQRPIQYALLKVKDFIVTQGKDDEISYLIQIPRSKQRFQMARTEFRTRAIIPKIGKLLMQHVANLNLEYSGKIENIDELPLFPAAWQKSEAPSLFEFHRTSMTIGDKLASTLKKLKVVSERTGDYLHISARRFRRTFGTRIAQEGHGELIIAELLDHTDTQNVGVYVEATPAIIERIDNAIALQLAPLAQAFAGKIISDESQATRSDDPTSRICSPQFEPSMRPIGNCGQFGFCGAFAPIACYTCTNFQPWADGPHERVLNYLLDEREIKIKNTDLRIASIHDRTILAVAEVVRRCKEMSIARLK